MDALQPVGRPQPFLVRPGQVQDGQTLRQVFFQPAKGKLHH
jgi:hypothetical protein